MADEDDPDLMAGELALGLLEGEERATALRRLLADTTFARTFDAWQTQLSPLGNLVSEASPSKGVWEKIEAAIGKHTEQSVLLSGIRRWKLTAATAATIAASLAIVIVLRPSPVSAPTATTPALFAQLGPSDARAVLLASYDQEKAVLTIVPATISTAGRSAELWVIPDGSKPHSLGLVDENGLTTITIPPALRATIHRGATIAVSIEPKGGSPTGQPTGPVVAMGKFTKI